ncbi:DUF47 domain-containing protein [Metabacillus bambusae]|uniref:DUF47 family protein n=1 Tax=Metabacillus bambusae TaxID=2795218 RepID=A0ABS3N6S7_9BACI|nr:DUF47 family protein [Metabacillus bambusae]MBO1513991.1 DUF47 family protein [Metabacillus bambusae]
MFFSRGKKDKFSSLLLQMTDNLQSATTFFLAQDISSNQGLQLLLKTIKEYEVNGDKYVETITKELSHTYITSIEREDLLQLAVYLDDVLDGMEHTAGLLEMYSVTKTTEHMKKFSQKIHDCSIEISSAVNLLSRKKLLSITPYSLKIKELESDTNNLLRMSIKNLFATMKDPIMIIQYKEIYESLEDIVNDCCKFAKTLDTIIMKNA